MVREGGTRNANLLQVGNNKEKKKLPFFANPWIVKASPSSLVGWFVSKYIEVKRIHACISVSR